MVERADTGDAAAKDALFAALYSELHRLAQAHIRNSSGPLTMGATTLLHEAYLSLNSRDSTVFPDRHRFMKYASRAMRGLLGESACPAPRRAHSRRSARCGALIKISGRL